MGLTALPTRCGLHGLQLPCYVCRVELKHLEAELHTFPSKEPASAEASLERMAIAIEKLVDLVGRIADG